MNLDCTYEFGFSREVVQKSRKDWSLSHDVKLLKYLEKFSQNLITRTGDAIKTLEEFEENISSVTSNILTVSQRFQSLANNQFIEHCVLEDDISAYNKPCKNLTQVSHQTSNPMLNNALSTCLTSIHLKYYRCKDGGALTKSSHIVGNILSDQPPLIGTLDFNDHYAHLMSLKGYFIAPMKKSEINSGGILSDVKQRNIQDSLSVCSSSNVEPGDDYSNALLENHVDNEVQPATNYLINHDNIGENAVPSRKDNDVIKNDVIGWIPKLPPKYRSLFDDNDDDTDSFLFDKTKPFSKIPFTEEENSVNQRLSTNKSDLSSSHESETINGKSLSRNYVTSNNKSFLGVLLNDSTNEPQNSNVNCMQNNSSLSDDFSDNSKHVLFPKQSSNICVPVKVHIPQNTSEDCKMFKNVSANDKASEDKTCCIDPPLKAPESTENKFTLFSDQDGSDDDLFTSTKQKRELNKDKSVNLNASVKDELTKKVASLASPGKISENDNGLPSYDTSMLHSLAKSRPRIRNKRRPPSRKHLKEFHISVSNESSYIKNNKGINQTKELEETSGNTVSVLSPSTEEEDLFIVPKLSLIHEISSSNLFLESTLLSPGSCLDNPRGSNDFLINGKHSDNINNDFDAYTVRSEKNNDSLIKSLYSDPTLPSCEAHVNISSAIPSKKIETPDFFLNNQSSLFNDSDDEDNLFFNNTNKRFYERKGTTMNSDILPQSESDNSIHKKLDKDFLKDMFSNDSDDDDLFKGKESSISSQTKPNLTKTQGEKAINPKFESNGNKCLISHTDFKDPLSVYNENQTD